MKLCGSPGNTKRSYFYCQVVKIPVFLAFLFLIFTPPHFFFSKYILSIFSCPAFLNGLHFCMYASRQHFCPIQFSSCLVAKLYLIVLGHHGLQPARILCPWDSPGKNTGVRCHFLLHGIFLTQGSKWCLLHQQAILYHGATSEAQTLHAAAAAKSLQSCLTLCNPIDGSPPVSSVPGVLQARTLEWVAISFSNAGK